MPRHYDPNQPRVLQGQHGGGQWTRGPQGLIQPAYLQFAPVIGGALQTVPRILQGIQRALALYAALSRLNTDNRRAVIAIKAHEYPIVEGVPVLESLRLLDRDQMKDECERLPDVQKRTDRAVKNVKALGIDFSPAVFGTKVHSDLKRQIDQDGDPDFKAEVSHLKGKEEGVAGQPGSIRVDVLERAKNKTVCVYDIKTGKSGLSLARIAQITQKVAETYHDWRRIIITEVRPTRP